MARLGKEKKPYVTLSQHLNYPVGTKCLASRPDGTTLHLEFEDGEVLELASYFFCPGLEDAQLLSQNVVLQLFQFVTEDMQKQEDEVVSQILSDACERLNKDGDQTEDDQ